MKEDLSHLPDDEVFAAARESLPVMRRFTCYAAVGWLGIAVLPLVLVGPHVYGRSMLPEFAFVVGVLHLAAIPGLRTAPATWMRIVGVLLALFLWPATRSRHVTHERATIARHRALLIEAGRRLERDPEGEAQRRWLEG